MASGYHGSYATGRFTSAIADCVIRPTPLLTGPPLPPVVYLAGLGSDAAEAMGALAFGAIAEVAAAVVRAGFHVVSPTVTATWGNSNCDTRIDDCVAWARANLPVSLEPPLILATSHGTTCGLCYAADHPIGGFVGMLPCIDQQYHITNDTGGIRSSINTAWGRSAGDTTTLPAGSNPAVMTTALGQVAQQLWYSTDDAVSTNVGTYTSSVGCELRSLGALGHTNAAVAAVTKTDVVKFFAHHSRRRVMVTS